MAETLTVKARYEADVAGYVRAMQTAARETDKAATSADKLAGANQKAADASTRAADRVAAAQDKVRDAQDRAADAAGRLKIAQAKLADARKSGNTTAIVTAEERLATAQRDVESTTRKAAAAQGAYETAVEQAAAAAGQLNGALEDTATKAGTVSEKIAANAASMEQVGTALMGVGGVLVAGFGGAVKTAADFEAAMSRVEAATHETPENMARMAEAAKRAGADTAFSAEEAAGGIEELAKAGVDAQAITSGALDASLSLAAAGAMEVGDAAEAMASAKAQFKLSAGELDHVADLFAAAAGKAQGSVKDISDALGQVGTVASQNGLEIDETVASLAAFAEQGLLGSDAGTSFKTMLQRMVPQSTAAAETMDELGISAYDAAGNFIGMKAYAQELQDGLQGLSDEQKNTALNTMFGADAIRAASIIAENGAAGIDQWTQAVADQGYAAETASTMQDNLAGDLEKLGGAFDTVFLQAGTGANDVLRDMVQGLEGFVDWVGALPSSVLSIGGVFAGVAGGGALLTGLALNTIPKIVETKNALNDLVPAGGRAHGALKKIGGLTGVASVIGGIAIAAIELGKATTDWDDTTPEKMATSLRNVANESGNLSAQRGQLDSLFSDWDRQFGNGMEDIDGMSAAIGRLANAEFGDGLNRWADDAFSWTGLAQSDASQVEDRVRAVGDELGNLVSEGNTEAASESFRLLAEEWTKSGRSAEELFNTYMPGLRDSLKATASEMGVSIDDTEALQWALSGVEPASVKAKQGMDEAAAAAGVLAEDAGAAKEDLGALAGMDTDGMVGIQNAIGAMADETLEFDERLDAVLDSLFRMGVMEQSAAEAAASYEAALDEISAAVEENGRTLDITTEKGRANQDALFGIADAGRALMTASAEAGASQGELRAQLEGTYDDLVAAGEQMGLTADDARLLAEQILGVPGGVDIETWMDNSAMVMAEATAGAIEAIPGYKGVAIAVSENGTVGSVQEKIDATTGKTVQVWVDDDGSTTTVQQEIRNIAGVERTVWVDDQGTVYATQQDINAVTGKVVDVKANALTAEAEGDLNYVARSRTTTVFARWDPASWNSPPQKNYVMRRASGGTARLPGFAGGGVLPYTGLGTDMILGVTSSGMPIARVDDGEWIINQRSSRKHHRLLDAINRDDPRLRALPGFASGGRLGGDLGGLNLAPLVYEFAQMRMAILTLTTVMGQVAKATTAQGAKASTGRRSTSGARPAVKKASPERKYSAGERRLIGFMKEAQTKQKGIANGRAGRDMMLNPDFESEGRRFIKILETKFGEVDRGRVHEDWSGRVFFKDGRQIYLTGWGPWKWVKPGDKDWAGRTERLRYPRFARGGRLPATGLGTDRILGVGPDGTPRAWLDDLEWVINQRSSSKYNDVLGLINRDDPRVRPLAGLAEGGRVGREWPAVPAAAVQVTASAPAVDAVAIGQVVGQYVDAAISRYQPVVKLGNREMKGAMVAANNHTRGR